MTPPEQMELGAKELEALLVYCVGTKRAAEVQEHFYRKGIGDAAKVAEKMSDYNKGDSRRRYALSNLATQIRALKPNEGKNG